MDPKNQDRAARIVLALATLLIVLALVVNLLSDETWSRVVSVAATFLGQSVAFFSQLWNGEKDFED